MDKQEEEVLTHLMEMLGKTVDMRNELDRLKLIESGAKILAKQWEKRLAFMGDGTSRKVFESAIEDLEDLLESNKKEEE